MEFKSPKLELSDVLLPITSSCICIIKKSSPTSNKSLDSSTLITFIVEPLMELTFAYAFTIDCEKSVFKKNKLINVTIIMLYIFDFIII